MSAGATVHHTGPANADVDPRFASEPDRPGSGRRAATESASRVPRWTPLPPGARRGTFVNCV